MAGGLGGSLCSLPSEDRGLSFGTLLLSKLKTLRYLSRGTSPHVILNFERRAFQTFGSACAMLWGEEAARREQKTISLSVYEETEHFTVSLNSGDSPLCVTPQLTNSHSHTQTHTQAFTRTQPEKRWARESVNSKQEIKWDGTEAEVVIIEIMLFIHNNNCSFQPPQSVTDSSSPAENTSICCFWEACTQYGILLFWCLQLAC